MKKRKLHFIWLKNIVFILSNKELYSNPSSEFRTDLTKSLKDKFTSGTTLTSESKLEKSFLSKIDSIFSLSSDFKSFSLVALAK